MGHATETPHHHVYHLLQQRLSEKVQANPGSETLTRILRLLFSPEEAELAGKLPHNLTPIEELSRSLAIPLDQLHDTVTRMARRGVLFDMECGGRRYVTLPPVIIGFFEFVFMRARPDLPMKELAHLFEHYFHEHDGAMAKAFWSGQTQLARSFVREESLPAADHAEVLDWERASHIVASATKISVAICQCQQTALFHGQACDRPTEVCLSFNFAAESLIRNGASREVNQAEAMAILSRSKEANLIQIGDNVQRHVSFICNCCSCCCHMLRGIRTFGLYQGVVSSNWMAEVDRETCKGCGECAKACPVEAIRMERGVTEGSKRQWAVRNETMCLGCGLCHSACQHGSLAMRQRLPRVLVPETIFEQRVAMAIERQRLAETIFDDPQRLSHRALGRVMRVLEKSPPFQAAMACEAIKSTFLKALVKGAKRQAGDLGRLFD